MTRVVIVGSLNSDIVVTAPRHPSPGETILGETVATFAGGKGANQAVAAARAGGTVSMVGRVGADAAGTALTGGLRAEGIDVDHVGICQHDPSGTALIVVATDSGENTIVVVAGANAKLRPVHVQDAFAGRGAHNGGVLLAQLEVPLPSVLRALELGRDRKMTTILNAAPATAGLGSLLPLVDLLVVNEHELGVASGVEGMDAGVAKLLGLVPAVIVTLGSDGALVTDRGGTDRIAAHAVEPVDTTGAGDAFCGVLAAAIAAGLDLRAAARRANAAGALATTKAGAQPSAPTADSIDRLLGEGA